MLNPLFLAGILLAGILAALLLYGSRRFHRAYEKAVEAALARAPEPARDPLTWEDTARLPVPVQRYLAFTGAIGKEKVQNVSISARGKMKMNRKANWAGIRVEQRNFYGDELIRIFYIDLTFLGLHMYGLHLYNRSEARMTGKLLGLFGILDAGGREPRISDTVTIFNDMCLFAPSALIDPRIRWEEIDNTTVKAVFHTEHCEVSALLYFGEDGRLLDFVTDDRYYDNQDGTFQRVRWSTPVKGYREMHGFRLFADGDAVWHFPDGEYRYIQFTEIADITYNS